MDLLSKDDFEPRLGSEFHLKLGDDQPRLSLKLIQVRDLSDRFPAPEGFRDPFSLLFEGPIEVPLAQSMRDLETTDGTIFNVFLVPVGKSNEGDLLYEATFN